MDSAKPSASDQLRTKAKKLEMLAALLDDGDLASELAGLFASPSAPAQTTVRVDNPSQPDTPTTRQPEQAKPLRRPAKRGLALAAIEMVNKAGTPVTAKAVTERLEDAGYPFGALNHQVAVSKVLRQAAKAGKIAPHHNGHDRSPIIYTPLGSASLFPVQGSPN